MGTRTTRARRVRALQGAALAGLLPLLTVGALTGCGAEEPDEETPTVVTGTVLEGEAPADGASVVLLGWPAVATDSVTLTVGGSTPARDLDVLGRAVADDDGSFSLDVDLEELTARADSAGVVDVRLQVEGQDETAVPATVRLARDPGTGATEVTPDDGVVLQLAP